mmetsp:Transcript_148257/g.210555  ORF Transcript_148257/g.210555 Transcript_148257/m.210555 type:complete len:285 (-) Transcript_148257:118-972(-)
MRYALHSTAQHHAGFRLILQANGLLPQTDGVRDELQGLSQHAALGLQVRLAIGGVDPETHRVRQGLHCLGEHRLGVRRLLQSGGLKPNVLVVGAVLAALRDELPCRLHLAGNLLQSRCGNPTGTVLRVARDHALQQRSGLLDVADIGVRLHLERVQVRQVAFWIHDRLSSNAVHDPVQLHRQHRTTSLAQLVQAPANAVRGHRRVGGAVTWCPHTWRSHSAVRRPGTHGRRHAHRRAHAHGRVRHGRSHSTHRRCHAHGGAHAHRSVRHGRCHAHRRVHAHGSS